MTLAGGCDFCSISSSRSESAALSYAACFVLSAPDIFFAWSLGGRKGCTLCRFWIFLGGFCEGIVRRFPHFLGRLGLGRIQRSENRAVKFCQRSRNGCSWGVPDPAPGGLRPQNPKPWLQIFSVAKNSRYSFFLFLLTLDVRKNNSCSILGM